MKIPFVGPIAVLGLIQIIIWFACFLTVAATLKVRGYPDVISSIPRDAIFMREWGLIYLLIPGVWTVWASWDLEENDSSQLSLKAHLMIGISLLIVTMGFAIGSVGLAGSFRIGTL